MKSPLLETYDIDPHHYGELRVMESAAGFYIGSLYYDPHMAGHAVPGTRDSGYYATREEALRDLENNSWTQREHL
jgi:hypothetical protein